MRRTLLTGLLPLLLCASEALRAQEPNSGRLTVGDASLHYLDFGGDGVPVVFIHAADRGAETWLDFAPQFTDNHRVLAMSARGVGQSTGEAGPTDQRASDLIHLLDELGLERAVFVGNSSPALDMTYLAENHRGRVAGLVYLANAPPIESVFASDPTGAFGHAIRATQPPMMFPFRPRYLDESGTRIDVPALTFVSESGTRGLERRPMPLMVAAMVEDQGADWIPDKEAREFLVRLARDDQLQAEVATAWRDHVTPAILGNEEAFRAAFGENLRLVPIPVPLVTGYEYRDRAELVVPHIRQFLDGLSR